MAAYLITEIRISDFETYKRYMELAPALIRKHGGKYIVRGGAPETIEGAWTPQRVVVLEFPDREAVRAFVDDPEYAPIKEIRLGSAESDMVLVDGVGHPGDGA